MRRPRSLFYSPLNAITQLLEPAADRARLAWDLRERASLHRKIQALDETRWGNDSPWVLSSQRREKVFMSLLMASAVAAFILTIFYWLSAVGAPQWPGASGWERLRLALHLILCLDGALILPWAMMEIYNARFCLHEPYRRHKSRERRLARLAAIDQRREARELRVACRSPLNPPPRRSARL